MDGIHDLGGRQGFGAVRHTPDAPAFHERWEERVNSLYAFAVRRGIFNMDEYRHAIERMEPRHYLSASYYERSLTSLATLLRREGPASPATSSSGARTAHFRSSCPVRRAAATRRRASASCSAIACACKADHVPGHVRMPAYIRGKVGVVVGESPPYPFPDAHAHGVARRGRADLRRALPQRRPVAEWRDAALVHVGVFQSYLARA